MKRLFEAAISAKSFRGKDLYNEVVDKLVSEIRIKSYVESIHKSLSKQDADYSILAVIRFAFLIELVKTPKIETTKFEVHWADRLKASDDPRFATYDECYDIFEKVLSTLAEALEIQENRELVQLFRKHHLLPYEVPLDYIVRLKDEPIHRAENVDWFWGDIPTKAVRLRDFLLSQASNAYHELFGKAYRNKIKVKTYLTDRVLTGAHKTNREKRWEAHPASVHYALRRDCLDMERTLIDQLCHFEGFPKDLFDSLVEKDLIRTTEEVFRCPVTMDPLSYADFEREILDPYHGKANFQVGHLNPLKAINDDPQSGHTAQNISWISQDGNRIQGSLSLSDARALIRRIAVNYERFGLK